MPSREKHSVLWTVEAREVVADLFKPNPFIYWADFLGSFLVGGICYAIVRRVDPWWLQVGCFLVSCLAFYRAVLFTHELTHLRRGTFRTFRFVWNLLCGIPFLLPSYTYHMHLAHHRAKDYGTERDGEYVPLGAGPPGKIVSYLLLSFLIPIAALARFLILVPIAWFVPRLRRWLDRHASSMVMDWSYVRPDPLPEERLVWRVQETACFLVWAGLALLLLRGVLPLSWLVQAYATGTFIILINEIRTIAAHRYDGHGEPMTFTEQVVDSINVPKRSILTWLLTPVGLRYHALHHLFPALPYHSLRTAHVRLIRQLPADSPYRLTVRDSLPGTLRELWRAAKSTQQPLTAKQSTMSGKLRGTCGMSREAERID